MDEPKMGLGAFSTRPCPCARLRFRPFTTLLGALAFISFAVHGMLRMKQIPMCFLSVCPTFHTTIGCLSRAFSEAGNSAPSLKQCHSCGDVCVVQGRSWQHIKSSCYLPRSGVPTKTSVGNGAAGHCLSLLTAQPNPTFTPCCVPSHTSQRSVRWWT